VLSLFEMLITLSE